ncbi:MAG TPA: putative glycoside hydrolase [Candidatus Baltobacteraceae bacterium]|nr:putative glycoside hydrolase [Candidatus Baltobacteraceae bacterium]
MKTFLRVSSLLLSLAMVAAVPRHVLTGDYWGGYAGTHNVPPDQAARWLSWAEVSPQDSAILAPLGIRTLLYTDPNREQPGDPMWSTQEAVFAHNCGGGRVRAGSNYAGQVLTDVHSPALQAAWKQSVARHMEGARYNAVFDDDAVGALYAADQPCNYNFDEWLSAHSRLIQGLGMPVIYNGLSDFYNRGVAREISLNRSAAGGMMEECYAQFKPDHRVGGWQWYTTEYTELRMAQEHKIFICYGRDLTPADQAYDGRIYTYASFLLTYDPKTTVLWEYYKTPTGGHVMPESQLVALDPVKQVKRVAQLRENEGVYLRQYRKCYFGGRSVGPCVAAVNPDEDTHRLRLPGFKRTLQLNGSGVFDGGSANIANVAPPSSLAPGGAVIAFK